jgi:hypothetical protein
MEASNENMENIFLFLFFLWRQYKLRIGFPTNDFIDCKRLLEGAYPDSVFSHSSIFYDWFRLQLFTGKLDVGVE